MLCEAAFASVSAAETPKPKPAPSDDIKVKIPPPFSAMDLAPAEDVEVKGRFDSAYETFTGEADRDHDGRPDYRARISREDSRASLEDLASGTTTELPKVYLNKESKSGVAPFRIGSEVWYLTFAYRTSDEKTGPAEGPESAPRRVTKIYDVCLKKGTKIPGSVREIPVRGLDFVIPSIVCDSDRHCMDMPTLPKEEIIKGYPGEITMFHKSVEEELKRLIELEAPKGVLLRYIDDMYGVELPRRISMDLMEPGHDTSAMFADLRTSGLESMTYFVEKNYGRRMITVPESAPAKAPDLVKMLKTPETRRTKKEFYKKPLFWAALGTAVAGAVVGIACALARDRPPDQPPVGKPRMDPWDAHD